jgi:hypothetical protein
LIYDKYTIGEVTKGEKMKKMQTWLDTKGAHIGLVIYACWGSYSSQLEMIFSVARGTLLPSFVVERSSLANKFGHQNEFVSIGSEIGTNEFLGVGILRVKLLPA